MFCNKCGNQISEEKNFCNKCGNQLKVNPSNTVPAPSAQSSAPSSAPSAGVHIDWASKLNPRLAMIIGGILLIIVVISVVVIANAKKEREIAAAESSQMAAAKQLEQEQRERDIADINDTMESYASAMANLDFEYAAEFWVPKKGNAAKSVTEMFGEIPYGGVIKGALPLLGSIAEFEYSIVPLEDIDISGEKASVKAGLWMDSPLDIVSSQKVCTIKLRKIDDAWLIESITEIKE